MRKGWARDWVRANEGQVLQQPRRRPRGLESASGVLPANLSPCRTQPETEPAVRSAGPQRGGKASWKHIQSMFIVGSTRGRPSQDSLRLPFWLRSPVLAFLPPFSKGPGWLACCPLAGGTGETSRGFLPRRTLWGPACPHPHREIRKGRRLRAHMATRMDSGAPTRFQTPSLLWVLLRWEQHGQRPGGEPRPGARALDRSLSLGTLLGVSLVL